MKGYILTILHEWLSYMSIILILALAIAIWRVSRWRLGMSKSNEKLFKVTCGLTKDVEKLQDRLNSLDRRVSRFEIGTDEEDDTLIRPKKRP